MRPVITADEATKRLLIIFPRDIFDTVLSSPIAGAAVAALIYVDAVTDNGLEGSFWARPSMVIWMNDEMRERSSQTDRLAWRNEAVKSAKDLAGLMNSWGVSSRPSYAENSRETLRDEIFRKWCELGALTERSDLPKTSSAGRWCLRPDFADLFLPELNQRDIEVGAEQWRDKYLSPALKIRLRFAASEAQSVHSVTVAIPNTGRIRTLEPGGASLILKAVIEDWAPLRLQNPYVITLSEPGDKLYQADAELLESIGLTLDVSSLLPDAMIADVRDDRVEIWFVEAAYTDGEINENRKNDFLSWAAQQHIEPGHCHFLTAFSSRNSGVARRRLKDLAIGTHVYFADEPGNELAWYMIADHKSGKR